MNKMKELINELNKASELYYNGKDSFLTDKEYDIKLEELKKLEQEQKIIYSNSPTINVGSPVLTELNKVQIKDKPMLSLDKVHSAQEIINFSDGYDLIASIKCDGLSVRLVYQDTDLVSANTRGNGYEGSDITEHIKHFLNVPLKIAKTGTYIIDGEAIIYDKDFEIINVNNEFKNNRNTASGTLALFDMSIVAFRRLSFIAWDVIKGGCSNYYHYNMEEAQELGFTIVPCMALDCTKVEKEEIEMVNADLIDVAREYGIPCDGVVWRINNIDVGNKKGQTAHHFLNAIAWKPTDEEYETTLKDIEWSMGRTGVLSPVAIYEDVEIDGSICNRASLHNLSVLEETLGTPYVGQEIRVFKANQIIPQISYGKPMEHFGGSGYILTEPRKCPICGGDTVIKVNNGVKTIWCDNSSCEGKLANQVDHYVGKKGLDIKGLSIKTIEKLIDWGWINGLRDIYKLSEHRADWVSKEGFGETSVGKILDSIDASKSNVSLESFISAIGVPLVGRTIAKEITKYYDTWEDFRAAIGGDWTQFFGFGDEISNAINKFDYSEADECAAMLTFKQPGNQNNDSLDGAAAIKDKVFVITGKLTSGQFKNRDELKADIESLGGKVTGSVTSKTDYLINNDSTSTSAKNKKAQELGVQIITEQQYLKIKASSD